MDKDKVKEILSKIDKRVNLVIIENLINEIHPFKDFLALIEIKRKINLIDNE